MQPGRLGDPSGEPGDFGKAKRSGRAGRRQKDLPCSGSKTRAEDAQIDNFWCDESDTSG